MLRTAYVPKTIACFLEVFRSVVLLLQIDRFILTARILFYSRFRFVDF